MILSEDMLRLLTGMSLLVPLSYALRFLNASSKYWWSVVLGAALQIYVFRGNMYPIYTQHLIVFALIKFKGPKCGLIVTIESMVFLSGYQIN